MGIPLRDAMKIYPFSRAELIGGAAGLDRVVESANIQEVPHVERWLKQGEILFSAGYAFQGLEISLEEMMERVNHLGAAALAVKPGQYLQEIPLDMIACANRIGLPLFRLPEDLPYMDCIIPILERITQKQLFQLRRVESIHEQLTRSILRAEGTDGICLTLYQVTGQPVFLLAPSGKAVLARCLGDALEDYELLIRERFLASRLAPNPTQLKPNQCNMLQFEGGNKAICVPIVVQGERLAYLLLDCTDCQLPDMDLIAFEHASSLIAIELLKEQALVEQEQKIREKLLEDLLMKRYGDEGMLYRRGLSVGIDLEKPYCIFLVDPDSFEDYIRQELVGHSEADIQTIKNRIHEVIRSEMRRFPGPQLLLNNSVSVVGMISVRRDEDVQLCREILTGMVQKLMALYPKLGFSAGIGRVKTDIREAEVSLREARLALNCSRLPQLRRQGRTVCFEELGALSFLSELTDSGAMREYYASHLGPLLDYDASHNTELVNTLDCYFRCGQNLRQTAEKLFIHKNSVIYRLRKAEALIGAPLSDSLMAFDLQLCLLLRNIL